MQTPPPNKLFLDTVQDVQTLKTKVAVIETDQKHLAEMAEDTKKWRERFGSRLIAAVAAAAALSGAVGTILGSLLKN